MSDLPLSLCDDNTAHEPHDMFDAGMHWRCVGLDKRCLVVRDAGEYAGALSMSFFR